MICFSPASRIILIESVSIFKIKLYLKCFSPASRIILIESEWGFRARRNGNQFQSRKQDYFNWKQKPTDQHQTNRKSFSPASRIILIERMGTSQLVSKPFCFSPASRIILIESDVETISKPFHDLMFQSRKQDYFNWKLALIWNQPQSDIPVSVPQAGLF